MIPCDLAIVIPVYKGIFFREALCSILDQTDKNFHIYIGDDASEDNIIGIIESFGKLPNLTYHRFDSNLGMISLASHWNRCIDMVRDESWIWLFSDDDIMDPTCVEEFKKSLGSNKNVKLFKYNSIKFQGNHNVIQKNIFPDKMDTVDLLRLKLNYTSESYVVEYLFHKSIFEKIEGFKDFSLGWCSDDLFWVNASLHTPIVTISNATVKWRHSDQNISGKRNSCDKSKKKIAASYTFIKALKQNKICSLNKNIEHWAIFWFMGQYNYLKQGVPKPYRFLFLLKVFMVFPYSYFSFILNRKKTQDHREQKLVIRP